LEIQRIRASAAFLKKSGKKLFIFYCLAAAAERPHSEFHKSFLVPLPGRLFCKKESLAVPALPLRSP
jgi:hypothetical protein